MMDLSGDRWISNAQAELCAPPQPAPSNEKLLERCEHAEAKIRHFPLWKSPPRDSLYFSATARQRSPSLYGTIRPSYSRIPGSPTDKSKCIHRPRTRGRIALSVEDDCTRTLL